MNAHAAIRYNKRRGYSRDLWKKIQKAIGAEQDGLPGYRTALAVADYQKQRFGSKHADGMVGLTTLRALHLADPPLGSLDATWYHVEPLEVGIDVSVWQGEINWAMASRWVDFAFIRCADGGLRVDKQFIRNRDGADKFDVKWGGYIPVRMGFRPKQVVDKLLSLAGAAPLPPVLDLEFKRVQEANNWSPDADAEWTLEALSLIQMELLDYPYVYLSHRSAKLLGDWAMREIASEAHLWWVDYGSVGLAPRRWGTDLWEVRQFTSSGRCPGISGPVDLNVKP